MNAAVRDYWEKFLELSPEVQRDTAFQVWYFGNTRDMAKELANLVVAGKKSATASLVAVNELRPEDAPVLDGYSVVTDLDDTPRCVIQTTEIRHMPFGEVDAQFAFDEGEGDQSLEYWRKVHYKYFTREAVKLGLDFNSFSMVCCERFTLSYPR
ncbi:MAG: ASCH domain-containing protein [Pyrinomonadaceae bacterium]